MTTSLRNAFDTLFDETHSEETVYDSNYAIDMIGQTITRLTKSKEDLEASIASDLEAAKAAYTSFRRSQALALMQRVRRNKAYKEIITGALFQLVPLRIELELSTDKPISIEQFDAFVLHVLKRLDSFECRPANEGMLARKLARMVGPHMKSTRTVGFYYQRQNESKRQIFEVVQ